MAVKYVGGYCLPDDRPLGSGGVGEVWYAYNDEHPSCVLKIIHRSIILRDENWRERLNDEAMTVMRVRSSGVAQVYDIELDGPRPFIVSQYIEGRTLAERIKEKAFSPREVTQLARSLYNTITDIHAANVLHRDIKPSNIMMSDSGPVLIDFGIARLQDAEPVTQTGVAVGTFAFLPPEVHQGERHSESSDWWAWAATLLQASTGRPPFGSGGDAVVFGRMFAGKPDTDGLPLAIGEAFGKALDPNPHYRIDPYTLCHCLDDWFSYNQVDDTCAHTCACSDEQAEYPVESTGSHTWTEVVGREHVIPFTSGEELEARDQYAEPYTDVVSSPIPLPTSTSFLPGGYEFLPHSEDTGGHEQGSAELGEGGRYAHYPQEWYGSAIGAAYAGKKTSGVSIFGGILVICVGYLAAWLGIAGMIVALAILFALTFFGIVRTGVEKRRLQYGESRPLDVGMTLLKTPYYLCKAVVSLTFSLLIGLLGATSAWLAIRVIQGFHAQQGTPLPDFLWPLRVLLRFTHQTVAVDSFIQSRLWSTTLCVLILITAILTWILPSSGYLRTGLGAVVLSIARPLWVRTVLGCLLVIVLFGSCWLLVGS